ncbi:hypothetical protein NPIL_308411 [Nephila pilipes]|uniref:Uncharacterized protein n=1 Tax=Nephila pilipes TaxID=299642 RepID=A0A8X6NRM1_NEPPI|nr:hypothetical protein NPIL_308411 [Nephila pilipes]
MYVDEYITGQEIREEALLISYHAKNITKKAGMEMRKWICNDTTLMSQWAVEGFDTYHLIYPSAWDQTRQKIPNLRPSIVPMISPPTTGPDRFNLDRLDSSSSMLQTKFTCSLVLDSWISHFEYN